MPRNIEIKARLADFNRTYALAKDLSDTGPEVIPQEDIFFEVPQGRLKLRLFGTGPGELIAYRRPDQAGPKASSYEIFRTENQQSLQRALAAALPVRQTVKKVRHLFLTGRTRIHLDRVEGLGDFLELEVVLEDGEDSAAGVREAQKLMQSLEINAGHLIEGAYVDLLGNSR